MLIKVDGVIKSYQYLKVLKSGVDILSLYDEDLNLIKGENNSISNSILFSSNCLRDNKDFIDVNIPDFAKEEEFNFFLEKMGEINKPKIAYGLCLTKEDNEIFEDESYLNRLIDVGVKYFVIEIDSIVNGDYLLSKKDILDFNILSEKIPFIAVDSYSLLNIEKFLKTLPNIKGILINLGGSNNYLSIKHKFIDSYKMITLLKK